MYYYCHTETGYFFLPFAFHFFRNDDCHLFLEKLYDKKIVNVEIDSLPGTNENYISRTDGGISYIDSCRLFSKGLDELVKTLHKDDFVILQKTFPDRWEYLNKKLANPFEYLYSIDVSKKPANKLRTKTYSVN